MALSDPGVSWNQKIDDAAITNNAVAVRAMAIGRCVTCLANRAHTPGRLLVRPMPKGRGTATTPRRPSNDKRIGCKERALSIETRGTTSPANPRDRTKGTGMRNSVARPSVTAKPEMSTVRPAEHIVATTASIGSDDSSASSSL